jgi:hypothetical protein
MKTVRLLFFFIMSMFLMNTRIIAQPINPVIDQILTLNGTKESTVTIVTRYIKQYRANKPNVPAAIWDKISSEVDYASFLVSVTSVYANNFSAPELESLLKYLQTKEVEKYQLLAQRVDDKLYVVSSQFGKELAKSIEQKLKTSGY